MADPQEEVEVTTPAGSVKLHGKDMLGILTILLIIGAAVYVYIHTVESAARQVTLVAILKDIKDAQLETNKQQKLATCIASRTDKEKAREFEAPNSFCQQMSR